MTFEREIFDFFLNFSDRSNVRCDPVYVPLVQLLRKLHRKPERRSLDRHRGFCHRLQEHVFGKRAMAFSDDGIRRLLGVEIDKAILAIEARSKELPERN